MDEDDGKRRERHGLVWVERFLEDEVVVLGRLCRKEIFSVVEAGYGGSPRSVVLGAEPDPGDYLPQELPCGGLPFPRHGILRLGVRVDIVVSLDRLYAGALWLESPYLLRNRISARMPRLLSMCIICA